MNLVTAVQAVNSLPQIGYGGHYLSLGSCFSEYVGARMADLGMDCLVNPWGVLYNPLSIAQHLKDIAQLNLLGQEDLFLRDGLFHSFRLHGSFSSESASEMIQRANLQLQKAHAGLEDLDVLYLTLGTSWVYELRDTGQVVANCHKVPHTAFRRRLMGVDEVTDCLQEALVGLLRLRPALRVVFQVSPIRHLGDGLHGNQVSKSTLLLATERLLEAFPGTSAYFPSYEIMLDELRDYRFYDEDMVHPSVLARKIIWERFVEASMSPETLEKMRLAEEFLLLLRHRPLQPTRERADRHMDLLRKKLARLEAECPGADFTKELESCRTLWTRSLS